MPWVWRTRLGPHVGKGLCSDPRGLGAWPPASDPLPSSSPSPLPSLLLSPPPPHGPRASQAVCSLLSSCSLGVSEPQGRPVCLPVFPGPQAPGHSIPSIPCGSGCPAALHLGLLASPCVRSSLLMAPSLHLALPLHLCPLLSSAVCASVPLSLSFICLSMPLPLVPSLGFPLCPHPCPLPRAPCPSTLTIALGC